ncbi:hypothetical protein CANCADRAFT_106814 [Tortispora caseinolytica NRRL Y-17796]|uniref:mRNA stability protein n=1 Tax=Tortispora caseinolytica NRRL Y-17796 TaxID=767744 RepID=A0A1E4TFH2_9ASCO|nr:hypothetical protein CANCADRAFT_106814 [Tortispora caseinolytica NRRL Y-17796]
MNDQDQEALKRYGKLPSRSAFLTQKLKDRKYFDSGDYALSKAGKTSDVDVTLGSEHPHPEDIPHSHVQSSNAASQSVTIPGAVSRSSSISGPQ